MVLIAKQQLQGVSSRGQIEYRLSLSLIEMQMLWIPGYGGVQIGQLFHINQQMVVSCLVANLTLGAGRCDSEPLDTESDSEGAFNNVSVRDADKKDPCSRWRGVGRDHE